MPDSFNLITSPAFRVRLRDNTFPFMSVREIAKNSANIIEFVGEPMEQATAMNTFLAVLREIGSQETGFSWDKVHTDHYDVTKWFSQVPELSKAEAPQLVPWRKFAKNSPAVIDNWAIGKVAHQIPSATNESIRMIPHPCDGAYELCQRCVTIGMLGNTLFARCEGPFASSLGGISPLYYWIVGESIAEFIKRNYVKKGDAAWVATNVLSRSVTEPLPFNQAQTVYPMIWKGDWNNPDEPNRKPCLLCGDIAMIHASRMSLCGFAFPKNLANKIDQAKDTNPREDPRLLTSKRTVKGKKGNPDRDEFDLIGAMSNPELIEKAANERSEGARWKAFGMIVQKTKKSEVREQVMYGSGGIRERFVTPRLVRVKDEGMSEAARITAIKAREEAIAQIIATCGKSNQNEIVDLYGSCEVKPELMRRLIAERPDLVFHVNDDGDLVVDDKKLDPFVTRMEDYLRDLSPDILARIRSACANGDYSRTVIMDLISELWRDARPHPLTSTKKKAIFERMLVEYALDPT